MSCTHSDPTANAAIGSIDRELRRLRRLAEEVRRARQGTPQQQAWAERQMHRFTGIYAVLLEEDGGGKEK